MRKQIMSPAARATLLAFGTALSGGILSTAPAVIQPAKRKKDARDDHKTMSARDQAKRLPNMRFTIDPPTKLTAEQQKTALSKADAKRQRRLVRNQRMNVGAE